MSIQAMAWVLEHSEADGYDRLVLLAIANHADAAGGLAWPSVARIASEAHVDRTTVHRALRRLGPPSERFPEALDELEVTPGGGRGRTNTYRLKRVQAATVKSNGNSGRNGGGTPQNAGINSGSWQQNSGSWQQNSGSSATLNRPNRHEPLVRTLCFNCGKDQNGCLCDTFHGGEPDAD